MKILQTTKEEITSWGYGVIDAMESVDVAIVDGVIVKNRDGHPNVDIGKAMFIWDERLES